MWKINNSLLQNLDYCSQLNDKIDDWMIDLENCADEQLKFELLKFEIRSFSMDFSKQFAKDQRKQKNILENIIKDYESKGGNTHYKEN